MRQQISFTFEVEFDESKYKLSVFTEFLETKLRDVIWSGGVTDESLRERIHWLECHVCNVLANQDASEAAAQVMVHNALGIIQQYGPQIKLDHSHLEAARDLIHDILP